MDQLQQWATAWLATLAAALPLGYAFGAGMVSAANPCGFAILPAYLGLYLAGHDAPTSASAGGLAGASTGRPIVRQVARAILVSLAVAAGFVVLFGGVGLVVAAGGRVLLGLAPWVAVVIGIALVALGIAMLRGARLSAAFAARLADRMGDAGTVSPRGFFVFGIAFGLASLSCTLPIFLTVVGLSLQAGGIASAALQFVSYALGMGAVVLALTLAVGVFKVGLADPLRRAGARLEGASAYLLVFAGAYVVYYWVVKGGLIGVV